MSDVAEIESKPLPAARDLRRQVQNDLGGLSQDVVFQHIRTGRDPVTIYSLQDGEPITIPQSLIHSAMQKTLENGSWMFTDNPDLAPTYKRGTIKCFLHKESTERASGLLEAVGLEGKDCIAGQLRSIQSARLHAQHRHRQEWEALSEYVAREERDEDRERQRQQLEATLALAQKAGVTAPEEAVYCGECDYSGTAKQVQGHRMGAHKTTQ